jgi:CRISPR/Cas system-associated exonuclease Cas4 (RecB family)
MLFKLSPSDFAYLYEECKHCYYLKVKQNIPRPSTPFPAVFTSLNSKIQGKLIGKNLKTLSNNLPDCKVEMQEGFVESTTIPDTSCYIKGKYDLLCKNTDGTYTIVDLKISQPNEEKIDKYKTQLYSYKFALENPLGRSPIKISKMGLLILYPESVKFENNTVAIDFPPVWMDIPEDQDLFFNFIKEVDTLLKGPIPKDSSECPFCRYFDTRNTDDN